MELVFHGGASQVGRSCIELRTKKGKYILDAGLWITPHGPEFPEEINDIDKIDAVFLSHAHLDHVGALPLLEHYGLNCPIYANIETKLITKLLLKDSFKISRIEHSHIAYNKNDIEKVLKFFNNVPFNKLQKINDISFKFFKSGHIPGSASILIETEGKRLVYTGDINLEKSRLLDGADLSYGDVDILITEATYGIKYHDLREDEEERFLNSVVKTLDRGGSVLIPAFAVGRAQEILMILGDKDFSVPIYLDGMARNVCEMIIDNPEFIKDPKKLREVLDKVHFITSVEERDSVLNEKCIIISTSGMVNGGPVLYYLSRIWKNMKNSILLTGYQAEHTNGRMLVENGSAMIDGYLIKVKAEIQKFDFSAHSGRKELEEMILRIKPKKVIVQHGDKEAVQGLGHWIKDQGIEVYTPEIGEIIKD